MSALFITPPGGSQWLIILLIVVLLFGAAKLPQLARGAGEALRIFRDETKGLTEGDDAESKNRDSESPNNSNNPESS